MVIGISLAAKTERSLVELWAHDESADFVRQT